MNAILFLVRREFINSIKELFRHPAKLIAYLFIAVMLGVSILSSGKGSAQQNVMDQRILHGIYMGILMMFCLPVLFSSLKNGTTFFKMSDVTYLFISPISSKKILAYGMVKQMGSTLLMLLFFLFYGVLAIKQFGVDWSGIILMLLGIAVALFLAQITGLLVYGFVNSRPRRILVVKIVLYAILLWAIATVAVLFLRYGGNGEALLKAVSSPYLELVPFMGWMKGLIFSVLAQASPQIFIYGGVLLLIAVAELWVFKSRDIDYYEDVLEATESMYQMKQAIKNSGSSMEAAAVRQKKPSKLRFTGIGRGQGANTFFFRHICEARRRSRLLFVSLSSVFIFVGVTCLCLFIQKMTSEKGNPIPPGILMVVATGAMCYILYFRNAAGDWTRELAKPYLYLVPASAFQKLLWASMTTLIQPAVEGTIILAVLCAVLRANPLTALICICIYTAAGFLLTAGNILSQRLFGRLSNRGIIMMFYFFVLIVLFAPGVVGSVCVIAAFGGSAPAVLAGLPFLIWCLGIGTAIYGACRNLLNTVEME